MPFETVMSMILEQASPLALAVFSMWMLDRVWNSRLDEVTRHAEQINELRRETLTALQQNTEAITRLSERGR